MVDFSSSKLNQLLRMCFAYNSTIDLRADLPTVTPSSVHTYSEQRGLVIERSGSVRASSHLELD
jgi:hypothetical protein